MQYRVPAKLHTEMHWRLAILAVATLLDGNELLLLIYAVRVCRLPSLLAMLLDTLYSKKWYDMLHIGCGIHSLRGPRFPALVDIRLVTISACALFFINYNNR